MQLDIWSCGSHLTIMREEKENCKQPPLHHCATKSNPAATYLWASCVGGKRICHYPYLSRFLLVGLCYLYLKIFLPSLDLQNLSELGVLFYSVVYSQDLAEAYKIFLEWRIIDLAESCIAPHSAWHSKNMRFLHLFFTLVLVYCNHSTLTCVKSGCILFSSGWACIL